MNKLDTEKFIKKSKVVHNNIYDYSKTNYINFKTNVIITCPIHGDFNCLPCKHLQKIGCKKCYFVKNKQTIDKFRMPLTEFINRSNKKHKNKYSYKNAIYVNARVKVKILCPIHGEFEQDPFNHLKGRGCPTCGFEQTSNSTRSNTSEFIGKSKSIHKHDYNYSKVNYISAHKQIIIICNKHGEFLQTPNSHLRGSGCPLCCKNISLKETAWLDSLNIPVEYRQYSLCGYKVDGYDPSTKTVYEFNGDFWHGNPKIYDLNKTNAKTGKTFKRLYDDTVHKERQLIKEGYTVITMWESDFKLTPMEYQKKST